MPTSSLGAIFIFAFVVSIGAVISPRPISAAIISKAPRRGWIVGPTVATGHSILELIFTILILFGLTNILSGELARMIIATLGGIVLILIGLSYLAGLRRGEIKLPEQNALKRPQSLTSMFNLGITTTISNPF